MKIRLLLNTHTVNQLTYELKFSEKGRRKSCALAGRYLINSAAVLLGDGRDNEEGVPHYNKITTK